MPRTLLLLSLLVPLGAMAPTVQSLPTLCGGVCYIEASQSAYLKPALPIQSGTDVVWRPGPLAGPSEFYTTVEGPGRHPGVQPCFLETHSGSRQSGSVRFSLVDGTLVATSRGIDRVCTSARAQADGSFVMLYSNSFSGTLGTLVVLPQ